MMLLFFHLHNFYKQENNIHDYFYIYSYISMKGNKKNATEFCTDNYSGKFVIKYADFDQGE